ncbi:probable helicase CHR10 isoform X2 [Nymphaea colorata]|uniref:probable helicase CHR10 isoform X2 n=1 Tax=Nymphaea colorata TaxID=210225 RepID=UPI00214E8189|nr:probable helicase CHR10 isoform X2 [Nymphaea colorata]
MMGLGKTLQAICFLSYLKFEQKIPGPFLILCPLSVTDGWMSEFATFSPNLKVMRYVGDKVLRCLLRKKMLEHVSKRCKGNPTLPFDAFLTTYDIAILDQEFLSQMPWCFAVLYNVLKSQFVLPRRLLLTGTPIQNNISELWALLHFCMPLLFGSLDDFVEAFKEAGGPVSGKNTSQFGALKYILKAFLLRRTKAMLTENGTLLLPPLTEITVLVPLVQLQKRVYVSILRRELPKILASSSGAPSQHALQNIVIQLRKACSHPYLFSGIEPEPFSEGEHLVLASGKLIVLDKILQKLSAGNHHVLLFAQMTQTLDILQDFLELRRYTYERLDGSVRAEERFAAIRRFSEQPSDRSSDSHLGQDDAFVFMISTRAGGVGLNLVAADTVIFYEQDWNPQVDKQALQRAHRIGQIKHVLSINLVTSGTVEEVIMRSAASKLQLSQNVIGGEYVTNNGDTEANVENADLKSSIVFGLDKFDPVDILEESFNDGNMSEVDSLAETVLQARFDDSGKKVDQGYEIGPMNVLDEGKLRLERNYASASVDPGFDEASYVSWLEKFKDADMPSQSSSDTNLRKQLLAEKVSELEADKQKKMEEKRLRKWEALGYQSLAVEEPPQSIGENALSDSGSVEFVFGDCTKPAKRCPSEPTVIFSCVDNSGIWGRGGMFDALLNLSSIVPDSYKKASECSDLHLGDLHFVRINGTNEEEKDEAVGDGPQWVALAVVQSYNPRRKVPRSNISMPDLEKCIRKACFSAARLSASIHMPRIGYQDGSERTEWYTVERLLRKYASAYGVKIFVYYFRRFA